MTRPQRHDYDDFYIDFQKHAQQLYLRIQTAAYDVFSFYSPEVWQYFSVDRETAELIAKGFAEYWAEHPTQIAIPPGAKQAAQVHRNVALTRLAECSFPMTDIECFWYIHPDATFRNPQQIDFLPPNAFLVYERRNPFEILQIELRNNNVQDIPDFTWQYFCGLLFYKLLVSKKPHRDPTVFIRTQSQSPPVENESETDTDSVPHGTMIRRPSDEHALNYSYFTDEGIEIAFAFSPSIPGTIVRIVTPGGGTYRLYQPESWEYVSVSRKIADDICGGFAEFWEDRPDEEVEPTDAAAEASFSHRRRILPRLAGYEFPISNGFSLDRNPVAHLTQEQNKELQAIRTSNPFLLYKRELDYHANEDSPVSHVWRHRAVQLFEQLLVSEEITKCPSAIGVQQIDERRPEKALKTSVATDEVQPESPKATPPVPDDVSHQRGPTLISQEALEPIHRRSDKRPVQWGPLFYETNAAYHSHFCVTGMPRSGKTTLLRLLFQSLHTNVTPPPRFVFYDAKANLIPHIFPPGSLTGDGLNERASDALFILSPYDERGTAWDIASDCSHQVAATEVAEILFPEPNRQTKDEFFSPAARDVTVEVMRALTRQVGSNWTLFDLLCSLKLENIEAVMSSNPGGAQSYATYFGASGRSTDDLIKTLRAKTALLLPSAAAWRFAKQRLGLRQWSQSHTKSIVLLRVKRHPKACNEINRILLSVLAQELLANEDPKARTFLYLDEFEHLQRIDQMVDLAHDGVSQQVNMALAFHDLGTLQEVYGGATEGIVGDAMFRAFFRVNTRSTSDWASHQIGAPEVKLRQDTKQHGSTKHEATREADPDRESSQEGETVSHQYAIRKLVLPDEVRDLPLPHETNKVTGYFMAPGHGPYRGTIPTSKLFRSAEDILSAQHSEENSYVLWPKVEGVSERCPQPDERYDVSDDTFFTLHQLGFVKPGYVPPTTATPPPATPSSQPEPLPPDEQYRRSQPPEPDISAADDEERSPPPAEPNYDFGINLDLRDD